MPERHVADAVRAFDAFMAEYTRELRRQLIDRQVERLDVVVTVVTDKGTVVGCSNPKREQMVLLLEKGLLAAKAEGAEVVANREVPLGSEPGG